MNKGFYLKMAWGNIRKNRNIYLPYLLAASVMTALFYIQGSLCDMVDISGMKGKRMMSSLLGISTPITGNGRPDGSEASAQPCGDIGAACNYGDRKGDRIR